MSGGLATVIGCVVLLTVVGVILKLALDDIRREGYLPVLCFADAKSGSLSP
jgi:hypothetical protein